MRERMYNIFVALMLLAILVMGVINYLMTKDLNSNSHTNTTTPTIEKTYVIKGKVICVSDSTVTVATKDGNEWEFVDDGYCVDDIVSITFSDNGTLSVYDDNIVSVD